MSTNRSSYVRHFLGNTLHDLEEWVLNPSSFHNLPTYKQQPTNQPFLLFCNEAVKNSIHHLLQINRSHYIVFLSKP